MELKITPIQTHLYWEDIDKNINHFKTLVDEISDDTDIIVLPEAFTTGFSMKPDLFQNRAFEAAIEFMKAVALQKKCCITGSTICLENGNYYNRLIWCMPDGSYSIYDKRHLFRMGQEDKFYCAGTNQLVVEYKGFKIRPLICYDLRFPVWSRNTYNTQTQTSAYDVLIYVANWPAVRSYPWRQLLIARAIENQCYVVGVNRIGVDGNDIAHDGSTMVIGFKGENLSDIPVNEQSLKTYTINLEELNTFRKTFPAGLDADLFQIV